MSGHPPQQQGFSLIEALVALAILAIASIGLIRAAEGHVEAVRGQESRAIARLVAENRLAELVLASGATARQDGPTEQNKQVEMLDRQWQVDVTTRPTDDPDIAEAFIAVREAGTPGPMVQLRGFLDHKAGGV